MTDEFELLARLRERLPAATAGQLWVGDDAAVLEGGLLVATDALVDGVHFRLESCGAESVGWKALAVNLSDLAAMGGIPSAALAAVVSPAALGAADGILAGMADAAAAFACPLVGGDLTSGPVLVCAVTVLGRAPASGAVTRGGARVGDTVFVTGSLGGAAAARRAVDAGAAADPAGRERLDRPVPRLAEGRAAAAAGATAMIDVSDGFARDLGHIADESGVGVRVEAARLPLGATATLVDALGGGDDYELVFTAPDPTAVAGAFSAAGCPAPTAVGRIVAEGRALETAEGERELTPVGWEHVV